MFLYIQAHLQAILLFQSIYDKNVKLRVILSHTDLMMWAHYILQDQKDKNLKFQIAFGYETMSQIWFLCNLVLWRMRSVLHTF
jgi:hypothetical protein